MCKNPRQQCDCSRFSIRDHCKHVCLDACLCPVVCCRWSSSWRLRRATHGLPFRARVYRGCPAWTHRCAPECRMTLSQRANPLSCWVESFCSMMVVFVFVFVVEVVRNAFGCNWEHLHSFSTGSAVQALSRHHSQSFAPYPPNVFLLRVYPKPVFLFETFFISSKCSCLLSAVSQFMLFTLMLICSTSRLLIYFECCRICPWTSLRSSRRETRCTSCQRCCEHFRLFSECQSLKELVDPNEGGCVSAGDVADLFGGTLHHHEHCSLKALDLEFLLMRAVLMLFGFLCVDFLLQECRVLGFSFSMIEIACWNVSMTSTNSALDLLKSFASLVFAVFVDTAEDMLVDLLCASASVEPVRLDLELMDAVQHCRDLVAFHVPN